MKQKKYLRSVLMVNILIISCLRSLFGQSFMEYAQSGKSKYDQKDYKGALADFNKAVELNPQNSEVYYRRGLCKYFLEDYEGASTDYSQAVSLDPQNTDAYFERGYTKYNHLKDPKGAIEDYTKVIALDPRHSTAYNNRGLAREDLKDYEAAIQDFDQAIRIRPDFPVAYSNRGLAKYDLKDYDGALEDLNVAFADQGYKNAWGMNFRGLAKFQKGQIKEALADFEKAVEFDSTTGVYHYNVGYMKNELGDIEGACEAFREANELNYQQAANMLQQVCGEEALAFGDIGNYLYVQDAANLLYTDQKNLLENKLKSYDDTTSTQIAIVVIPSLNGENLEAYSINKAEELGIGQKGKDNGLMILIAKDDRKMRIEVGYGLEGTITDLLAKDLIDNYLSPNFRQGRFYDGLDQCTDAIIKLLEGEFKPDDISRGRGSRVNAGSSDTTFWGITIFVILGIVMLAILIAVFSGGGGGGGGTYSSSGSSYYSSSSSSWSSSSSSSSWSSGGGSSFGGGSFGGGGASGGW